MKLTDELRAEIECALDMRKKNGDNVWEDGTELEVKIAGTFAGDKFIVIKKGGRAVSSLPFAEGEFKPKHGLTTDQRDVGEGQSDRRRDAGSSVDEDTTVTSEVSDSTE